MHKVIQVQTQDNYHLKLLFASGEYRLFDMSPYLNKGVFTQLKDVSAFTQAFVAWDTVCWPNELDISPDTLYLKSVPINENHCPDQFIRTTIRLSP